MALCSASLRLSKSFVIGGDFGAKDGLFAVPLLKEEVGFMMGQIHNVISNLEEEQRVGVKGKSDEEIEADGRK